MLKKTTFPIEEVLTRGVAEILPNTNGFAQRLEKGKIRLYLGIDPTGSFLHLGHSVVLRKLQQFAQLGHEVILLIGNGTVRIGDPTGRDESRPVLTDEEIEKNFVNWKAQASKILNFDLITIKHNGDWLDKLNYAELIKLMAKTTVQQLMERDMFQERLKKGLPIHGHEIMYPLMQGYDSVAMDVDLEIGGTDQTFNMMMGRTLQKTYNNKEKWVLTTPIINGTDGRKMSKSFNNFVALTETNLDMYGKLMRVADELIVEYFTLLTDIHQDEIDKIKKDLEQGKNPMEWKKILAWEITRQYHDETAADEAQKHFEATIQNKTLVDTAETAKKEDLVGKNANEIVVLLTRESNSQARRLIEQGAVSLLPDEIKLADIQAIPDLKNVAGIRIGKRRFYKLV
ncbi:MAG: tyrosine--tRNA ligase [Candidatus Pacebacteria bacterium CG10_big_fil_rev_8_21_14_0_10_36_11]|nr:tyrosine--tRNA ligase [Candidatus Pacearchaeota archaeon]OIP74104.1 MAG: tyrosine--tRNA ligase [Candidatus Pacebacteria bacterium CG2_30_36_39]PIR64471.1 MAG: tyrosine--tRNA ligase [Candidatus Pacebacteria bacterium CG10_big_fil_rev_8_21_14_0_10_36_11]PJC42708.1 MAG: tyrosine--tRNA ligase [Candidatus Pacebacteria bacterium CG_4_9_14_0_2_um_filter_36_8]